ncbi:HalD/BesD family halogenase [Streptomyces sp. NPDC054796]
MKDACELSATVTPENVDSILDKHIAENFDEERTRKASQQFRREGYVKVRDLVPDAVFEALQEETYRLIDQYEKRIDVTLPETSDSPRYMSTVSASAIAEDGVIIPAVYASESLKAALSRIAAEPVIDCPWEGEKYAILHQHKKGDTHGWHWGDFSYAIVWLIEAPDLKYGGALQCVPHTDWDKSNPRVMDYLLENPIRTYGNVTRDLYFFRTDTTLHRTIPLSEDKTRIILNTTFAGERDLNKEVTHETMGAMFD